MASQLSYIYHREYVHTRTGYRRYVAHIYLYILYTWPVDISLGIHISQEYFTAVFIPFTINGPRNVIKRYE